MTRHLIGYIDDLCLDQKERAGRICTGRLGLDLGRSARAVLRDLSAHNNLRLHADRGIHGKQIWTFIRVVVGERCPSKRGVPLINEQAAAAFRRVVVDYAVCQGQIAVVTHPDGAAVEILVVDEADVALAGQEKSPPELTRRAQC